LIQYVGPLKQFKILYTSPITANYVYRYAESVFTANEIPDGDRQRLRISNARRIDETLGVEGEE
jgi:hypothetical protein